VTLRAALRIAALAGQGIAAATVQAQGVIRTTDSLRLSGRPWHAAETLLAAAKRESNPNAFLIVEGAKAEVQARRFEHARALLFGAPWLNDYRGAFPARARARADASRCHPRGARRPRV